MHLENIKDKCQGIASCNVKLEVSRHKFPGTGLQTGIGCSDTGLDSSIYF